MAKHLFAFLISTCILPNIEAVSNMHSLSLVKKSLHEHMRCRIELAWAFSIVMLLFLTKVLLLFWVKALPLKKQLGQDMAQQQAPTDGAPGNSSAAASPQARLLPWPSPPPSLFRLHGFHHLCCSVLTPWSATRWTDSSRSSQDQFSLLQDQLGHRGDHHLNFGSHYS